MRAHKKIIVTGKVIGVSFRAHAARLAQTLDLTGFVRNQPDQSVLIEVEGDPQKIQEFLAWCQHGPKQAQVQKCLVTDGTQKNYQNFKILY